MASHKKGNITWNQSGLKANTCKWPEVQKNGRNKVMIGFGFASDLLRGWCKISGPITEHTQVKPLQSWIIFDTQLKIALSRAVPCFSFEAYIMSLKGDSGFNSHLKPVNCFRIRVRLSNPKAITWVTLPQIQFFQVQKIFKVIL